MGTVTQETQTVVPLTGFNITAGRLKVVGPDYPGETIGFGTKVYLDGQEVERVKAIDIHISVADIVTATITQIEDK